MFTVTVTAPDRNLLTLAEMKDALGITDSASDARLTTLGLQLSDMVSSECRVPSDGAAIPTLLGETIVETIRLVNTVNPLILSRRFLSSITSVVEDDIALASTDYEIERAGGLLSRLDSAGIVICWSAREIVVTYVAGFATVPPALKLAATTILREQWAATKRDPLLKRDRVEGVSEREYWVNTSTGSQTAGMISGPAASMLDSYRYWPL